jgi:hypothetical protein
VSRTSSCDVWYLSSFQLSTTTANRYVINFENILKNRIEELNIKLKESNNLRESDILINKIDTLDSILGQLFDLKYSDKGADETLRRQEQSYKE